MHPLPRHPAALPLCLFSLAAAPVHAALLAYDGFDSTVYNAVASGSGGGYKNPSVGPSDALFYDNDTIFENADGVTSFEVGQNGPVHGFSGAWRYHTNISSSVYPRLETSQLSYGGLTPTTPGQLNLFRSFGSGATKSFSRDLNVGASSNFGSTLYIGGLIQRTSDTTFSLAFTTTDGASIRNFAMFIGADGSAAMTGENATGVTSAAGAWGVGTPEFFVLKLENSVLDGGASPTNGDRMSLYINPDLANEAANDAAIVIGDDNSSFFVTDNPDWSLGTMTIGSGLSAVDQSVIFDEFKIGTEWSDMLATIPEPSSSLLLAGFLLMVCGRRKR